MLRKLKAWGIWLYRRLRLVNWVGIAFAILKATRKENQVVDEKYIVVRPRMLSDENYLKGISVLRATLAFVPPAAIAVPILGLGAMGFKIWKRIALSKEYGRLEYPPVDPNMLRLSIEMDTELKRHYGNLILEPNWNPESIAVLEAVYNDFQFITNAELLRAKYPHFSPKYITDSALVNQHTLQVNLDKIEQTLVKVSQKAEIDHDIGDAVRAVRELFPVMNDWALFNSEGFDEIVELVDAVF